MGKSDILHTKAIHTTNHKINDVIRMIVEFSIIAHENFRSNHVQIKFYLSSCIAYSLQFSKTSQNSNSSKHTCAKMTGESLIIT